MLVALLNLFFSSLSVCLYLSAVWCHVVFNNCRILFKDLACRYILAPPFCGLGCFPLYSCDSVVADIDYNTAVPTKSDSDVILCLHLLSKTRPCTFHLS